MPTNKYKRSSKDTHPERPQHLLDNTFVLAFKQRMGKNMTEWERETEG